MYNTPFNPNYTSPAPSYGEAVPSFPPGPPPSDNPQAGTPYKSDSLTSPVAFHRSPSQSFYVPPHPNSPMHQAGGYGGGGYGGGGNTMDSQQQIQMLQLQLEQQKLHMQHQQFMHQQQQPAPASPPAPAAASPSHSSMDPLTAALLVSSLQKGSQSAPAPAPAAAAPIVISNNNNNNNSSSSSSTSSSSSSAAAAAAAGVGVMGPGMILIAGQMWSKWHYGLYDCCSKPKTCIYATLCPCHLYGKMKEYESFPLGTGYCGGFTDGFVYCMFPCYGAAMRVHFRRRWFVLGSGCDDFFTATFCPVCSTVQMYKELKFKLGKAPVVMAMV